MYVKLTINFVAKHNASSYNKRCPVADQFASKK